MKKFILTAIVAVIAVSANAQMWIGGEIGLNTVKTSFDGTELSKNSNVKVLPEIGYSLNENWDVAVCLGYEHAEGTQIAGVKVNCANSFAINPYARYTYAKVGDLKFFVDGGFTYGFVHEQGVDDNLNLWNVGLKPGLAYSLSPKTTLVAHVGDLSYSFAKTGDLKVNSFNLGLDNSITFGVNFAF